jgi:hypothetical protein
MAILRSAEYEKLAPTKLEEEAVELRWRVFGSGMGTFRLRTRFGS